MLKFKKKRTDNENFFVSNFSFRTMPFWSRAHWTRVSCRQLVGEMDLGLLLDHDRPFSDPTLIRPLTGGSDPEIIILNHVSADSSQSIVQLGYTLPWCFLKLNIIADHGVFLYQNHFVQNQVRNHANLSKYLPS